MATRAAGLRSDFAYAVKDESESNGLSESKALDEFTAEDEREVVAEGEPDFAAEGEPDFEAKRQPDELPIWATDSTPKVLPRPIDEPRARARRWPIMIPVAVVVVAASAGYGLASRDVVLPSLPSAPVSWPTAEPHVRAIPIPDVPEAVVTPPAAGDTPPASGAVTPPASDAVTPPVAAGSVPASGGPLRAAIDEALAGVSRSYRALDAPSLTQVWPGADVVALSQRFSTLKYQSLSFDRCDLRPVGAQIVAACEVSIAAAANAGDPALQRRHESWSIVLNRSGDRYVIGSVATR